MWRIATCVSGARITRPDGDVVAIPRGLFEHMARVEKDVVGVTVLARKAR